MADRHTNPCLKRKREEILDIDKAGLPKNEDTPLTDLFDDLVDIHRSGDSSVTISDIDQRRDGEVDIGEQFQNFMFFVSSGLLKFRLEYSKESEDRRWMDKPFEIIKAFDEEDSPGYWVCPQTGEVISDLSRFYMHFFFTDEFDKLIRCQGEENG